MERKAEILEHKLVDADCIAHAHQTADDVSHSVIDRLCETKGVKVHEAMRTLWGNGTLDRDVLLTACMRFSKTRRLPRRGDFSARRWSSTSEGKS